MPKPNFFIVGAPRCGTTSMFTYLKQHPEIYLPVQKEPHFFGSDLTPLAGSFPEEELYLSLFAGAGERPRVGEGSVHYLASERAPHEIKAYVPDARIIALLRDPVDMVYSLFGLYQRSGNEDLPTLEEALDAEPERREGGRLAPGTYYPEGLLYTREGCYAPMVERYLQVFGRAQVHVILFDDMVREPAAVYRRVLEFLGVDPAFAAELDPHRSLLAVRMQGLRQLREAHPEVRKRIQFGHIKQHEAPLKMPPLAAQTRARLRELFAPDVERLGALLGRDLSHWLREKEGKKDKGEAREKAGAGLREILESVRLIKKIPPELRATAERVETLEQKFGRWQRLRIPELPLEQRPSNPEWRDWFAAERERIRAALGGAAVLVEHFGSTSVPGLPSKNIVDIAVGIDDGGDLPSDRRRQVADLAALGYGDYGNSPVDPDTIWLWRIEDDRAYAVHLGPRERPWIDEQMALRDYFRSHPDERDRYAELKRNLARDQGRSYLQFTVGKMAMSLEMVDKACAWRRAQPAASRERSTISR